MKLLHLTHQANLHSILKRGLLPTYIENSDHWELFQKYIKQRFCVYLWDAEIYKNEKYVRDMIYTKMFIHPRNRIFIQRERENNENGLHYQNDELYLDFKKFGNGLVGDNSLYFMLEIDSKDVELDGAWEHTQEPHDNKYNTSIIMDDYYAHNDKNVYLSENIIKPENIKIVEEVLVRKYKNNSLGFTFRSN